MSALLLGLLLASRGAPVHHADVLVSAGHAGRPASCAQYPNRACNLGTAGERAWTPTVAAAAARALRAHGLRVALLPADFPGTYDVKAAVFIHFDGSVVPCQSAASVGYHSVNARRAARLWHRMYGRVFPFGFKPDNFTQGLRDYYGFKQVRASDGALVLELGEMTCPKQRRWLAVRLQWEGRFIAHFIRALLAGSRCASPVAPVRVMGSLPSNDQLWQRLF